MLPPETKLPINPTPEKDALRARIEAMAERYENTSRDVWSRPEVIADNLRRALRETEESSDA